MRNRRDRHRTESTKRNYFMILNDSSNLELLCVCRAQGQMLLQVALFIECNSALKACVDAHDFCCSTLFTLLPE